MPSVKYAIVKVLELVLSVTCIIYKRVSDDEGRRLSLRQEKQNYRWPLFRYITWEANGSSYADITYGSYVLITTALLIGYLSGELAGARRMEGFLLGFGALLFIAVGSLELASLDMVPEDLVDNGAVLGVLSLLTGLLFLADLLLSGKRRKEDRLEQLKKKPGKDKMTQIDNGKVGYGAMDLLSHKLNGHIANGSAGKPGQDDKHDKVVGQLKSSLKGKKIESEPLHVTFPSDILNPPPDLSVTDQNRKPRSTTQDTIFEEPQEYLQMDEINQRSHKISKRNGVLPGSSIPEEDETDDILKVPDVTFLKVKQSSFRGKSSPPRKTEMLPMAPLGDEEREIQKRRSTEKPPLSSMEIARKLPEDDRDNQRDFAREVVIMSPTEREEYLAYIKEKTKRRMADQYAQVSTSPTEVKTYTTIQNIEVGDDSARQTPQEVSYMSIREREQYLLGGYKLDNNQRERDDKSDRARPSSVLSSYDFCEDISNMPQVERERYLFGESPKQKMRVTPSPDSEKDGTRKSPESKLSITTPTDKEGHWRFDSRDANLVSSSRDKRDTRDSPSSPMDPGYVMHTAQNWPHSSPKTPSQSPTDITLEKPASRISSDDSDTSTSPGQQVMVSNVPSTSRVIRVPPPPKESYPKTKRSPTRPDTPDDDEFEEVPAGGSLTTQLLQKWLKQRHTKVTKMRSNP
ncbi:histone H3.v1 [Anabrus simplex]|uniref:histone H3.v1 n=1 Tax=Anabrus simplex TaxID=316456 RepID=UPI0035A2B8F1